MCKIIRLVLIFLLGLTVLISCGRVDTPKTCITLGSKVEIFKNETVKVTGATKEAGKIIVEMEIDFNEITLENFEILLSGYAVDVLNYDKEETIACNSEDVFSEGYTGSVVLIFKDDGILDEHELYKYTIVVIYDDGDTRIGSRDYLLAEWKPKEMP